MNWMYLLALLVAAAADVGAAMAAVAPSIPEESESASKSSGHDLFSLSVELQLSTEAKASLTAGSSLSCRPKSRRGADTESKVSPCKIQS